MKPPTAMLTILRGCHQPWDPDVDSAAHLKSSVGFSRMRSIALRADGAQAIAVWMQQRGTTWQQPNQVISLALVAPALLLPGGRRATQQPSFTNHAVSSAHRDHRSHCNVPSLPSPPAGVYTKVSDSDALRTDVSRPLKASTGITGLAVHPDPLPALLSTYRSTLAILSQMPQEAVYRQATEAIINHRIKVVEASKGDIEHVEKELDAGIVEQLIQQATDEERLAGKMREWKA